MQNGNLQEGNGSTLIWIIGGEIASLDGQVYMYEYVSYILHLDEALEKSANRSYKLRCVVFAHEVLESLFNSLSSSLATQCG